MSGEITLPDAGRPVLKGALVATCCLATLAVNTAPADAYSFERDLAKSKQWNNGSYWCATTDGTPDAGLPGGKLPRAYGCIKMYGDKLQIADGRADGRRVGMQWKTSYGRSGICVNKYGKDFRVDGSFQFPGGDRVCNKNFREGSWITFRVGTCNGSHKNCSKLSNWSHWSDWTKRKNQ